MPRAGTAKVTTGSTQGKKRTTEQYASDDGFVANGGSDDNEEPKAKKAKSEKKGKGKAAKANKNAEQFWEISDKRRVSIDTFNGQHRVNIREYYEKDGELLPGKKGISLTVPQLNEFLWVLPEVEAALISKGETVKRPVYNGKPAGGHDGADEEHEEKDETKGNKSTKKNFEETSEEDEE